MLDEVKDICTAGTAAERIEKLKNNPEVAVALFKEGYNCSQAVLATYCCELGMDMEMALRLASSFGGGIGRLREVCGAASSMFMAAGLKYGYIDPKDSTLKEKHYELVQKLAQRFMESKRWNTYRMKNKQLRRCQGSCLFFSKNLLLQFA